MTTPDNEEVNLNTLAEEYNSPEKAREYLEQLRWPEGAVCPHCSSKEHYKITAAEGRKKRAAREGLYKCGTCWRQFTVTVGTIFEDSKLPLNKWLLAFFILGSSKKAVSANQMSRMLGIGYKAAWFMCHRIRHAMKPAVVRKLAGTVEVDETFVGGKSDKDRSRSGKTVVAALIERGGEVRTQVVASVTNRNMKKILAEFVSKGAVLNTDSHAAYLGAGREFAGHDVVNHSKGEYTRGGATGRTAGVNHCESFFSLLKRGIVGSFHHVSPEHLPRYCDELSFRWNTRKLTDGERFKVALGMTEGKRLKYRETVSKKPLP